MRPRDTRPTPTLFLSLLLGAYVMIFAPRQTSAKPFLPDDIAVGADVVGSFSIDLTESPLDTEPSSTSGHYLFTGSNNRMSVTIGGVTLSTQPTDPNLLVRISNSVNDFIQISSPGDEASFAPLLTGFARQNPALSPTGNILLNFRFPSTYLDSDVMPTSIDPSATQGPSQPFQTGIFAQVEGVSMQTPTAGIREWAFFFEMDPSNVAITADQNTLSGAFRGVIIEVDDRTVAVPEPAAILLFGLGLAGWVLRRSRVGDVTVECRSPRLTNHPNPPLCRTQPSSS